MCNKCYVSVHVCIYTYRQGQVPSTSSGFELQIFLKTIFSHSLFFQNIFRFSVFKMICFSFTEVILQFISSSISSCLSHTAELQWFASDISQFFSLITTCDPLQVPTIHLKNKDESVQLSFICLLFFFFVLLLSFRAIISPAGKLCL